MSLLLHTCANCAHTCFPPRLICHRCGGADWREVDVDGGVIEEVTEVSHQADASPGTGPIYLASVRTNLGPLILARCDRAVQRGAPVRLAMSECDGVVGTTA